MLFKRCRNYLDGDDYPLGWFQPPGEVKRENVILWILWVLFSTETYQPEWEEEIDEYLLDIESILGRKLESGYNDTAKCMRLTFDPVVMLHRPLLWYFVSFRDSSRDIHHLIHHACTRSSVVWTFTHRYRFALVDFNIIPLLNGSSVSHLALTLSSLINQLILIYRTGTAPIARQRSYLYCSFMVLGYSYSPLFCQSQTNMPTRRSAYGPTSPSFTNSSTKIPTWAFS